MYDTGNNIFMIAGGPGLKNCQISLEFQLCGKVTVVAHPCYSSPKTALSFLPTIQFWGELKDFD